VRMCTGWLGSTFQLLPQPENVGVDRARMRMAFVAEYLAEYFTA
jgi:hypothetical protein